MSLESLGGEERRRAPPVPDSQQIFVGNLPHTAGEDELKVWGLNTSLCSFFISIVFFIVSYINFFFRSHFYKLIADSQSVFNIPFLGICK